jgi:phage tail-like protein
MRTFTGTTVLTGLVACILLSASTLPAPDPPLVGFSVGLEIEGSLAAYLTGVTEVGSRTEIVEQRIVGPGGQEIILKVPGATRYLDIVAERGITSSMVLSDWRHQIEAGEIEPARHAIGLLLFDQELQLVAQWEGASCWPSAIDNLLPDDTGLPVEVLEIACDTVVRVQ